MLETELSETSHLTNRRSVQCNDLNNQEVGRGASFPTVTQVDCSIKVVFLGSFRLFHGSDVCTCACREPVDGEKE